MRKILVAAILTAAVSGAAFAQPSQGQGGAAAGVNGNSPTAPNSGMQSDQMRNGTTGMSTGSSGGQNGSPTSPQKNPTSPTGRASEGQTAPK